MKLFKYSRTFLPISSSLFTVLPPKSFHFMGYQVIARHDSLSLPKNRYQYLLSFSTGLQRILRIYDPNRLEGRQSGSSSRMVQRLQQGWDHSVHSRLSRTQSEGYRYGKFHWKCLSEILNHWNFEWEINV